MEKEIEIAMAGIAVARCLMSGLIARLACAVRLRIPGAGTGAEEGNF